MAINWRVYGSSTVVSSLDKSEFNGFFKNIVVGPNEAAVIIKDGKIEDTISGTRKNTTGIWDKFKNIWGRSPDLQVIFVDTSPIDFTFYLGTSARQEIGSEIGDFTTTKDDAYETIEARARERIDSTDLTISALTSDGQNVSAEVGVTVRINTEDARLLTSLLRGNTSVADWDIGALVRDELMAKALVPTIGQHSGSEIRGNQDLINTISNNAQTLLQTKFDLYGLKLVNMAITWGLTEEDELMIEEGKKDREERAIEFAHTRKIREQSRELELERQRVSNLIELQQLESQGKADEAELILSADIKRENLVVGKKIDQAKITAEIKQIELDINQKEDLLQIDTEKVAAETRIAIEERQALFDQSLRERETLFNQDIKSKEEERRQSSMDADSQRGISEMEQLQKIQIDRQKANRDGEQAAKQQQSKEEQDKLNARLNASQSRTAEEQKTLREAINKGGSVDPSVLREMFKQGTDREYTETTDSKMESRSKSQQSESEKHSDNIQENDDLENDTDTSTSNIQDEPNVPTETIICGSCSFELQISWKSCPNCGVQVQNKCKNCNQELESNWSSCPMCGLKLN